MNDAILIGIGTVLADDPQLTCRLPGMEAFSPVRVVLDQRLAIAGGQRVGEKRARDAGLGRGRARCAGAGRARPARAGVEVLHAPAQAGRLDLAAVLRLLAERGITRLMVEGGPMVAASFVAADLVDEAALFRSAKTHRPRRHRRAGGHARSKR